MKRQGRRSKKGASGEWRKGGDMCIMPNNPHIVISVLYEDWRRANVIMWPTPRTRPRFLAPFLAHTLTHPTHSAMQILYKNCGLITTLQHEQSAICNLQLKLKLQLNANANPWRMPLANCQSASKASWYVHSDSKES